MDWNSLFTGLGIGLFCALAVFFWQLAKRSKEKASYKSETSKLKGMLSDRMDLESTGLSSLKTEMERLRKENENLRLTASALAQKPGRKEIQRLQVYQEAVDRLTISSPGFGAAWQTSLREAEENIDKTYTGALPFFRKLVPQKRASAPKVNLIEARTEDQGTTERPKP